MKNATRIIVGLVLCFVASATQAEGQEWGIRIQVRDRETHEPVRFAKAFVLDDGGASIVIGDPSDDFGNIWGAIDGRGGTDVAVMVYVSARSYRGEAEVPLVTEYRSKRSITTVWLDRTPASAPSAVAPSEAPQSQMESSEQPEPDSSSRFSAEPIAPIPEPPPPPPLAWPAPEAEPRYDSADVGVSGPSTRSVVAVIGSGVSLAATAVAWRLREGYADDFNEDPACGVRLKGNGGNHCDSLDSKVSTWETVSIVGLAGTGISALLAVIFYFNDAASAEAAAWCAPEQRARGLGCAIRF